MTALVVHRNHPDATSMGLPIEAPWTAGVGTDSKDLAKQLKLNTAEFSTLATSLGSELSSSETPASEFLSTRWRAEQGIPGKWSAEQDIREKLYDALAAFKIRTATVAMHLENEWRRGLFRQLDSLLSAEDWEPEDAPPTLGSYMTFLRMLLLLKPERRPGLGASSDGRLIATWTIGKDRLTVECLPRDSVRWHLTTTIDGELERAAALTPLQRLRAVLDPYWPDRWFKNAE